MSEIPLGKTTEYPTEYAPQVLFPIPRQEARSMLGLSKDLPFVGQDVWNAWELTWLDSSGKPQVATATIVVNANSPNIIESKSLKLYLNSLSMTRYKSVDEVNNVIVKDLSDVAASAVTVTIVPASESMVGVITNFNGHCIDDAEFDGIPYKVDETCLKIDKKKSVSEELFSHLLRSNCPVTKQPDSGSLLIRYNGPQINRSSLLEYIVSYRRVNDFHESCIERIFVDIEKQCQPSALSVYARYCRRGGLDINPFRSNFEESTENSRLWRQ